MKLKLNQKAPLFTLPDQDGKEHSLKEYLGQWVLLYFYPKDDTAGCTKEACVIQESLPNFKKLKIAVLGVSIDPVKSHRKFADKYGLRFTLLSDEDKKVVRLYGVWAKKKFMGREYEYMGTLRNSYLIDPRGKIKKIYEKVNPETHAEEVLKDLKEMYWPE